MRIGFEVFNIEFNCSRATTSRALEQIRVVYSRGFAFLLCMVSFTAQGKIGDSEELKSFISSPPIITKLIYSHYYPGKTKKYPPVFSFVEWQPDAFVRIESTNLNDVVRALTDKVRRGEINARYGGVYWLAEPSSRSFFVWDSELNQADSNNLVFSSVSESLGGLSDLINFGIEHAEIGAIRWEGDSFGYTNSAGGNTWLLSGEMLADNGGRAESLDLALTLFQKDYAIPRKWRWSIDYSYDKPLSLRYLPSRVTTSLIVGAHKQVLDEFRILEIEATNQAIPESSFHPSVFVPASIYTKFVITNNGVEYYALGSWHMQWKPNDPRILQPHDQRIKHVRIIYFIFAVMLFGPIIFLLARRRASNQTR
ncbi:MAG TPA: hypothetical protein VGY98_04950 [Verrucomicrobiae bacterium]|nr:hypothetical protein [Verrucomicrobiae bacterium]